MNRPPRIVVVGSVNNDIVLRVPELPHPGQTIMASDSTEGCGGKGANQAIAAARAGGDVTMIGRIGEDAAGERLLSNLKQEGVHVEAVLKTSGSPTGRAIVAVDDHGENLILVEPGANAALCPEDVKDAERLIAAADVLLLQLEIPMETALAAMGIARRSSVPVILNPAPAPASISSQLFAVDWICPNEREAAALLGRRIESEQDAVSAAGELLRRGARGAVITRSSQGAVVAAGDQTCRIEPIAVTVRDTTGAGDAFAGALAVAIAERKPPHEAARFASAAAALAVTRHGAQAALARRAEIEALV